ncbi:MAG: thioredoxin fold domain-containing protein [Bacteroidia bacterium]
MKKLFKILSMFSMFFLFASVACVNDDGAGIKFFEGTWQEALKKSGSENKLIFLDLSTSWCGWCKKMKANTFSNKEVGEYFNSTFVNMELDAEQGEGQRLAQKFGVSGYPTVYLVDKNENLILSSEGYHEADELIQLIKSAMKEKK